VTQKRLAAAEKQRRALTLAALHIRVLRRWRLWANENDPQKAQPLERGVLSKVLGAWDRDGTPIAGTVYDNWMWKDSSQLFEDHNGQPGFLKSTVTEKCSQSCMATSEEECGAPYAKRNAGACSRGRVFRVRFKKVDTIAAMADWFVCRCNTGVMQFAGSEQEEWYRSKNSWVKASLKPSGLTFDVRLHAAEMLDDKVTHCFRDFSKWIRTKPSFAQPTNVSMAAFSPESMDLLPASNLDALALSPFKDITTTYNKVKNLWREECLFQPMPKRYPEGTAPGSDDASLEIYHMREVKGLNPEPHPYQASRDRSNYALELPQAALSGSQPAMVR